ncbi:MAG: peptidylprolyl isomerase [Methanobacteriota archaeon]
MDDDMKTRKRSNPPQKRNPLKSRGVQIGLVLIIVVLIAISVYAFYPRNQNNNNTTPTGNPIAVIDTTLGTIKVELYADEMPITTANFVKLANDGFYSGLVFHRVMNDFMVQGGGFWPNGTQKQDSYGPIQFETNPEVLHVDGAISMARTPDINSATSQFFICDGAQQALDDEYRQQNFGERGYAAFGVVIEGLDVVRAIAALDPENTTAKYGMENWPIDDVLINSITIEYQ